MRLLRRGDLRVHVGTAARDLGEGVPSWSAGDDADAQAMLANNIAAVQGASAFAQSRRG
jgi:hypothetical protein